MSECQSPFGPEVVAPQLYDPVLQPALDEAARIQRELDLYPDAPEDFRMELRGRLDDLWPVLDRPVQVSGCLTMARIDVLDKGQEYMYGAVIVDAESGVEHPFTEGYSEVVDETLCVSQGFEIVEDGRIAYDGEDLGVRYAVKLLFSREVMFKASDDDDELPILCEMECVADLDAVTLDFAGKSDAFAGHISKEYFPAYVQSLEGNLDGCDTTAEKILAIRHLEAAHGHFITTVELEALEQYVSMQLEVDGDAVPYRIKFSPKTLLFKPEKPLEQAGIYLKQDALIAICGLEILPSIDVEVLSETEATLTARRGYVEPRLILQLLRGTPDQDSGIMAVRLRDIVALESMRSYFHRTMMRPRD